MIRVGIVTINDIRPNYGNKLQNYASVRVFEKLGCNVNTLITQTQRNILHINIKRFLNKISGYRLSNYQLHWNKEVKFDCFDRRYLHRSFKLLKKQELTGFDFFAAGSDQVWNPLWYYGNIQDMFLLTFAEPKKKICMAPSFGIDTMPEEWRTYFSKYLNEFPILAVREVSGVNIIKELTGRTATVLIDPTMLLDRTDWHKISKKSRGREKDKKYILKYFLGKQNDKNIENIRKIAIDNKLEIYELMDINQPLIFEAGPCEFIDLIENAELICTDSFHACVFSVLFNKPFLVFDRDGTGAGMGSRISTLLSMLGLERKMPGMVSDKDIFEHDYSEAYVKLSHERDKANDFLKKSLGIQCY